MAAGQEHTIGNIVPLFDLDNPNIPGIPPDRDTETGERAGRAAKCRRGDAMTRARHTGALSRTEPRRWGRRLALLALGAGLLPGCATFFDDIRARSPEPGLWNNITFRTKLAFNMYEPMEVLASNDDGDMRRRAYLRLKEPKVGSEEYETVLGVLRKAASQERDMVVRMAAVTRLSQFEDPRATQILVEAWQAPANSGEGAVPVRMAVVKALGQRGDEAGLQVIATAMQKDQPADLRLTAADALGGFKEVQAAGSLIQVLREERDISLKNRAHRSLQKMTGKSNVPMQAEAWETAVRGSTTGKQLTKETNPTLMLANWWNNE